MPAADRLPIRSAPRTGRRPDVDSGLFERVRGSGQFATGIAFGAFNGYRADRGRAGKPTASGGMFDEQDRFFIESAAATQPGSAGAARPGTVPSALGAERQTLPPPFEARQARSRIREGWVVKLARAAGLPTNRLCSRSVSQGDACATCTIPGGSSTNAAGPATCGFTTFGVRSCRGLSHCRIPANERQADAGLLP